MSIGNISIDKWTHFLAGWAIAATLFPLGFWASMVIAMLFGLVKEYWDSKGHGTPDVYDFLATSLGGIAGALACLVIGAIHG